MEPMSLPGLIPQLAAPRAETAEAAALRLARLSLEALALKAGQVLEARVVGTTSSGLTQLSIAGQLLNVRLPQPLPAGTQLTVQVRAAESQSLPVLAVQPRAAPRPAALAPPCTAMAQQLPLPPAAILPPAVQGQTSPPAPNALVPAPPLPAGAPPPAVQASQAASPTIPTPSPPAVPAAQQDSIAPLLQNLSVIHNRAGELPRPVTEAALRLLAGRLDLDRGGPTGEGLRRAVLRSGIFLEALAKPAAGQRPLPGDSKAALLQLRGALTAWLGEGIAPVAPVTRRPQPPARGAQPRAERSEPPTLPQSAAPKEAGRMLLDQTEAALARMRLLQLASLPQDAARNIAAEQAGAAEWNLEIPVVLGHELAVALLQIARDGKGRSERRERGWRMQFSLNFSALGEVGALVSLVGRSTSVVIWAEAGETAAALTEMLPELAPALAAKGLSVGSVRVRHGRPQEAQPQSGQLLDSAG